MKLEETGAPNAEEDFRTRSRRPKAPAKWTDLSLKEVTDGFLKAKSGAPGRDKITVDVLRQLEPDINKVHRLVNKDLREGKASMRDAELVLIPKLGRDSSTAKGWRPVALLPTTGKGLERALAKWLGETGLTKGWFGENQAGGIPGRSTTDVALRMMADLEMKQEGKNSHKAWKTLVCMDVRGAFNAAKKDYVYKVLRDKGVPENVVKLAVDFMSNRTVHPRRGRVKGNSIHLDDGLAQGSPMSPVLFSLLLSPVMIGHRSRYSYADDVAMIAWGNTAEESLANAETEANTLAEEIRRVGLEVEPAKTEALTFHGVRTEPPR